MKATEEFNHDFRPNSRSKQEEEAFDPSCFNNDYDDPVVDLRLICIKYGIPFSF